jgi:hypothetical protein
VEEEEEEEEEGTSNRLTGRTQAFRWMGEIEGPTSGIMRKSPGGTLPTRFWSILEVRAIVPTGLAVMAGV